MTRYRFVRRWPFIVRRVKPVGYDIWSLVAAVINFTFDDKRRVVIAGRELGFIRPDGRYHSYPRGDKQ